MQYKHLIKTKPTTHSVMNNFKKLEDTAKNLTLDNLKLFIVNTMLEQKNEICEKEKNHISSYFVFLI